MILDFGCPHCTRHARYSDTIKKQFVSFQCVFLIYCMSPLDGSTFIYSKFIVPVFYKNRSAIDDILNKGSSTIGKFTDDAIEKGLFLFATLGLAIRFDSSQTNKFSLFLKIKTIWKWMNPLIKIFFQPQV